MQRKILYSYLGELRMILFILIASVCFSILNAQDILFEENFEAASGAENILDNYLGWESGEFDNTTNNNYFWVFDNTRTTVISGSYSMAVSENNPVNSSTTEYKDNQAASTLVYHTTPIDASNYTNLTLDFKWIGLGETIFDYGRVMYSLDANTWTELAVYEGETTVQTITNLDLSDVDQESFYIGFGWINDGSIGGFPGFIVDDITIKGTLLPTCSIPTTQPTFLNLSAAGDTVSGSFTAASPAPDNYLVVISTSATASIPVNGSSYNVGDTIGIGTVVDLDNDVNFTATGLTNATTYYIYIFSFNSECLGGPIYYINTPLSSNIDTTNSIYCTPSTTTSNTYLYINNVEFIGTLNDVTNNGNGASTTSNGYSDFTTLTKSIQAQGEGVNVYVGSNSGRGHYKAWIDWNNDGSFANDATETIYDTGDIGTATTTFGFIIPESQPIGNYKLRIRFFTSDENGTENYSTDFNACEEFNSDDNGTNSPNDDIDNYGEAEDYLFTVIESCSMKIQSITDGSSCGPGSVNLTVTGSTGVTAFNWYDAETGGNLVATTSSGNWSPNVTTTTNYWVTASDGNCESLKRTKAVANINALTALSLWPENPTICGDDDIIQISVTGETEISYLIDEDFESGGLGVFTNVNYIDNGTTDNNLSKWQNQASVYVPDNEVWYPAVSSGFSGNKFAMATSDVNPINGFVYESLESSIIDTRTFTNLTLSFDFYFSKYLTGLDPDYIYVYVSPDGGTTWTAIYAINDDIGYGTDFQNISLDLSSYINNENLIISFDYYALWADGVAIDNIKVFGSKPMIPSFNWTGTVEAFTDANATVPYVEGEEVGSVYIKPTAAQILQSNFTFTANATLSNGCIVEKEINITNNTKTWNDAGEVDWFDGSKWIPAGEPTIYSCVIIHNNVELPDTAVRTGFAKSVTITSSGNLEITEGKTLTVVDQIEIDSGGELIVKDDASLVQVTDVASNENEGTITMERKVENVDNLDYVYWSSSVDAFNVEEISSNATSEPIYEWIPTIGDAYGNWQAASGTMNIGKGYIVRGLSTVSPANTAIFQGVANNGIIEAPIQRGLYNGEGYINPINGVEVLATDDNWNLIGNPYPSSISANKFTNDNTSIDGTIYLWNYNSSPSVDNDDPFYDDFTYNYDENNYIEHNNTGSNPPGTDDLFIASGQAFFVLMLETAPQSGVVTFSNTMRKSTYDNSNFYGPNFETDDILEKQRIWLDLINSDNLALSILIGYVEGATDSNDRLYDAYEMAGSAFSFYSLSNSEKMSIQGKSLPFNISDYVTLGANFPENGNYTIAINTLDGVFEQGNQNIYLQDTYLDIIHNLKLTPYNFNSESGSFDDRFVLRYTNTTLNTKDYDTKTQIDVLAYHNNLKVESETILINKVIIYDTQGRLVQTFSNINSLSFKKKILNLNSSSYLVNIILENGQVYNKKVVFN